MPPLQAAFIAFVLAAFGDPVDVQRPGRNGEVLLLSEETRRLMLGDESRSGDYVGFGKKAVPWLNRAMLLSMGNPNSKGGSKLWRQIVWLIDHGEGRGFLALLYLRLGVAIRERRLDNPTVELIQKIERGHQ